MLLIPAIIYILFIEQLSLRCLHEHAFTAIIFRHDSDGWLQIMLMGGNVYKCYGSVFPFTYFIWTFKILSSQKCCLSPWTSSTSTPVSDSIRFFQSESLMGIMSHLNQFHSTGTWTRAINLMLRLHLTIIIISTHHQHRWTFMRKPLYLQKIYFEKKLFTSMKNSVTSMWICAFVRIRWTFHY